MHVTLTPPITNNEQIESIQVVILFICGINSVLFEIKKSRFDLFNLIDLNSFVFNLKYFSLMHIAHIICVIFQNKKQKFL